MQAGASPAQVAAVVLGSDEFKHVRVGGLYHTLLHRDADSFGLAFIVSSLQLGARDEQVIAVIAASDEYFSR